MFSGEAFLVGRLAWESSLAALRSRCSARSVFPSLRCNVASDTQARSRRL